MPSLATHYVNPQRPLNWRWPINTGLVANWATAPLPYQGRGKTWYDMVRGALPPNDGTLTNFNFDSTDGWRGAQGRKGGYGSLLFDGSTVAQAVTTNLFVGTVSTLSFWMTATALPGAGTYRAPIMQAGGGGSIYYGFLAENGKLQVWSSADTNGGVSFGLSAVVWYHVALVRLGDSLASGLFLYVNGAVVGQSATTTFNISPESLWIGNQSNVTNRIWYGLLDDVRIYSRALSDADVQALYLESASGYPRGWNWEPWSPQFAPASAGGPWPWFMDADLAGGMLTMGGLA